MPGTSPGVNYKASQRFLKEADLKQALLSLFDAEAPFSIRDVTEVERPYAQRTGYVGRISDGKTLGFWCWVSRMPVGRSLLPLSATRKRRSIRS